MEAAQAEKGSSKLLFQAAVPAGVGGQRGSSRLSHWSRVGAAEPPATGRRSEQEPGRRTAPRGANGEPAWRPSGRRRRGRGAVLAAPRRLWTWPRSPLPTRRGASPGPASAARCAQEAGARRGRSREIRGCGQERRRGRARPEAGRAQGIKGVPRGPHSAPSLPFLANSPSSAPSSSSQHGALVGRREAADHRPLGQGGRGRSRRGHPREAAGGVSLDPAVLRPLREPLQRQRHLQQPPGQGPREKGADLLRRGHQAPGQHQGDLRQAERAALREAARGPRELQASGQHPHHCPGRPPWERVHPQHSCRLPEADQGRGPLPGPQVPLDLLVGIAPACPPRHAWSPS